MTGTGVSGVTVTTRVVMISLTFTERLLPLSPLFRAAVIIVGPGACSFLAGSFLAAAGLAPARRPPGQWFLPACLIKMAA